MKIIVEGKAKSDGRDLRYQWSPEQFEKEAEAYVEEFFLPDTVIVLIAPETWEEYDDALDPMVSITLELIPDFPF